MWLMFTVMHPKDADRMADSVDPDQTSQSSLIWIYTVCPGPFVLIISGEGQSIAWLVWQNGSVFCFQVEDGKWWDKDETW